MTVRSVHRYGDHPAQVGELFQPAHGPVGVAVVLHGGFWRASYDRHVMDEVCADLAAAGWAAWNLEYRRTAGGDGGWPATFLDVAAGIDHLAELGKAEGLPLGDAPVAAIGHSAGGHLALWAAARPRLPDEAPGAVPLVSVTHAVSQGGVVDLLAANRLALSGRASRELIGSDPDEHPENWRLASPGAFLPLGVPQLLVHGGRDEIVPPSLSSEYARRARAAGDQARALLLPGVGHFEHLDPRSEAWAAVRDFLPRPQPPD